MSTTVTVRPASTSQATGITLSGGAGSLHATLNDNSDTTFATCTDGCYGDMHMGGAALPAGAIPLYVVPRLRLHSAAAGITIGFGTIIGEVILDPLSTGTYTTIVGQALAGFTAAQLNAGVEVALSASDGNVLVSEAYLDVVYVAVPVVNVTSPSGSIAVTQPTVTWTFSGDFPEARFQVKVFSSAQYGAVGFSPDASSAFYDSGEQLGSARSFTPLENLPNGDTYRFYVRAAQVVGSTVQWSAWDFTEEPVSVTPPAPPVLHITPNNVNARIKIKATQTGTPAWDFVTIQRTTDGVNWVDVRAGSREATFGHNFTIYDYETGNGERAQYRAAAIEASAGGDISSGWSAVSAPVAWTSTSTWLKSPTAPTSNMIVNLNGIPTMKRRLPRGIFDVAGRPDSVAVTDVRHLVEGTVTFATVEFDELTALLALLDRSETLLLQTPPGHRFGSRYISCGDADENRQSPLAEEDARYVVVPFTQVLAPVGDVTTFGVTWSDVEATYATWTALQTAQPTWAKLLQAQLS